MADEATKDAVDVNALRAELSAKDERAKRFEGQLATAERELARFKGVDLEKLKADSDALAQLTREQAGKNPEDLKKWQDAQTAKIRGEIQKQIDELAEENKKLKGTNHELMVVDRAMEKLAPRFNDDGHGFIKDYIRRSVDRNDKGEFLIKGEDGEARYSKANPAHYLSLDEWADELANKHPSIAKATTPRGSGRATERVNGSAGSIDVARYAKMSREQQLAIPAKERGELATAYLSTIKLRQS